MFDSVFINESHNFMTVVVLKITKKGCVFVVRQNNDAERPIKPYLYEHSTIIK